MLGGGGSRARRPGPRLRPRPKPAPGDDRVARRRDRWRAGRRARPRPREPRLLAARQLVRARGDPRHCRRNRARGRGDRQHPDRRVRGNHADRCRRDLAQGRPTQHWAYTPGVGLPAASAVAHSCRWAAHRCSDRLRRRRRRVPHRPESHRLPCPVDAPGRRYSLAIITATSALALTTHLLARRGLDVPVTLAMAAGCIVGAVAGTSLSGRVPQRQLGRGFATMVAAVAGYLIISAAASAARPHPEQAPVSGVLRSAGRGECGHFCGRGCGRIPWRGPQIAGSLRANVRSFARERLQRGEGPRPSHPPLRAVETPGIEPGSAVA